MTRRSVFERVAKASPDPSDLHLPRPERKLKLRPLKRKDK